MRRCLPWTISVIRPAKISFAPAPQIHQRGLMHHSDNAASWVKPQDRRAVRRSYQTAELSAKRRVLRPARAQRRVVLGLLRAAQPARGAPRDRPVARRDPRDHPPRLAARPPRERAAGPLRRVGGLCDGSQLRDLAPEQLALRSRRKGRAPCRGNRPRRRRGAGGRSGPRPCRSPQRTRPGR